MERRFRPFDPDGNPQAICAKRPYNRIKLFEAWQARLILDTMRKGDRPMTTLEIVAAGVADLKFWRRRRQGDEKPRPVEFALSVESSRLRRQGGRARDG